MGSYQIVQLNGSHTLVHPRDDLLGDAGSVDMFRVQSITQARDTSCDFVELNPFLATV